MKSTTSFIFTSLTARLGVSLCFLASILITACGPVYAIDDQQRQIYDAGIGYFDLVEGERKKFTPPVVGTGGPLVGCDNFQKAYNFFIGQGFTPPQAAGIMGNLQAESGINPKRVQSTSTPDGDRDNITVDGETGYGIAQWTSAGRQQNLADFAAANNVISGDLGIQLRFVMKELTESYNESSLIPLHAAQTVQEAVNVILTDYERPADVPGQRPVREGFALDILQRFGSGGGC